MSDGGRWTWAAARARGTSHARTGAPCQDMVRVRPKGDGFVALVSDGAGSASRGGAGAALACRFLERCITVEGIAFESLPSNEAARSWIDEFRNELELVAGRHGISVRDFAATLVGCATRGDEALLMLVGDGAAAIRTANGWQVPSWPEHGEYASTTFFLTDTTLRLRLVRVNGIDAVALFSDGLERLALDFSQTRAHHPFFDGLIRPVEASAAAGGDRRLSLALRRWLDSDAVNSRTDDDKAIVLAVRR